MSLFLIFAGAAVVSFFTSETMDLALAAPFHGGHVYGSSWYCSGAVESSSRLASFEVSVAMDDYTSASFVFACPS